MGLSLLDKLRIKLQRFDCTEAENPRLRGLSRQEALYHCERKMNELLTSYIEGDVSGYQCRVFFNDFIRDSIRFEDELALRKRHEENVEIATMERIAELEENEAEHALIAIVKSFRRHEFSFDDAKARLEHIIWMFPDEKQDEWRSMFSKLCYYRS